MPENVHEAWGWPKGGVSTGERPTVVKSEGRETPHDPAGQAWGLRFSGLV